MPRKSSSSRFHCSQCHGFVNRFFYSFHLQNVFSQIYFWTTKKPFRIPSQSKWFNSNVRCSSIITHVSMHSCTHEPPVLRFALTFQNVSNLERRPFLLTTFHSIVATVNSCYPSSSFIIGRQYWGWEKRRRREMLTCVDSLGKMGFPFWHIDDDAKCKEK